MSESCPHQAVLKAVHPVHKEMGLGMHYALQYTRKMKMVAGIY